MEALMDSRKNKLTLEKMAYLELWLKNNDLTFRPFNEVVEILKKDFNYEEMLYLLEAYLMPFEEVNDLIKLYDSKKPKMDEIKFINDLGKSYNALPKTVISRIKHARGVAKVFNKNKEIIFECQSDFDEARQIAIKEKSIFNRH